MYEKLKLTEEDIFNADHHSMFRGLSREESVEMIKELHRNLSSGVSSMAASGNYSGGMDKFWSDVDKLLYQMSLPQMTVLSENIGTPFVWSEPEGKTKDKLDSFLESVSAYLISVEQSKDSSGNIQQ